MKCSVEMFETNRYASIKNQEINPDDDQIDSGKIPMRDGSQCVHCVAEICSALQGRSNPPQPWFGAAHDKPRVANDEAKKSI